MLYYQFELLKLALVNLLHCSRMFRIREQKASLSFLQIVTPVAQISLESSILLLNDE